MTTAARRTAVTYPTVRSLERQGATFTVHAAADAVMALLTGALDSATTDRAENHKGGYLPDFGVGQSLRFDAMHLRDLAERICGRAKTLEQVADTWQKPAAAVR